MAAAAAGACIAVGQFGLVLGGGRWAARLLHAGLLILVATPFTGLLALVPTLWRTDREGAGFALGTLVVALVGVLLAFAAG